MRNRLFLLFVLVFLAGCFPVGRDFPTFPVEKIRANETTKDQIYSYFGEPLEKGFDSGYETWTYSYNLWSLSGLQTKRLYILFNRDGTVRTYSFSSS